MCRNITQTYKNTPPPPPLTPSLLPSPPKGAEGQAPPSLWGERGGGSRGWGMGWWGGGGVCLYVCVMLRNINREVVSSREQTRDACFQVFQTHLFPPFFGQLLRTCFRSRILINPFSNHLNVPWARIWRKYNGNSSHKPPGASYPAQGPQKQSEILKNLFFRNYNKLKF